MLLSLPGQDEPIHAVLHAGQQAAPKARQEPAYPPPRLGLRDSDVAENRASLRPLPPLAALLMSTVHVSFELNPATHLVLLSVRSKYTASIKFSVKKEKKPGSRQKENNTESNPKNGPEQEEEITGDGVILYGQNYKLTIASYTFNLVWRELWQKLSGGEEKKNPNLL